MSQIATQKVRVHSLHNPMPNDALDNLISLWPEGASNNQSGLSSQRSQLCSLAKILGNSMISAHASWRFWLFKNFKRTRVIIALS